ncbi:uncharacterized protein LY89DRAFT_177280 [Mollisia scopiformis]|uniref:Uncharacterized protein n=1 Tax=Mollisia scopiformis TaxID=149040 RepID=A0A194XSY7_MOLSC|nr:uncharacterized protein LY89DRAFT_177280 [Mollisia scopiformis]KUJ23256.1 hypothetical protein LY89DRAFT_177280 [Mollisia scopiformis]
MRVAALVMPLLQLSALFPQERRGTRDQGESWAQPKRASSQNRAEQGGRLGTTPGPPRSGRRITTKIYYYYHPSSYDPSHHTLHLAAGPARSGQVSKTSKRRPVAKQRPPALLESRPRRACQ